MAGGGRGKQQVMIVDRERLGTLISKMLDKQYRTDIATDAVKAFGMLRDHSPDIVVADIDVPGSGIRLAEMLRICPGFETVPLILTSNQPTQDAVTRARNAGANSYLAKPFGPRDLRLRIDNLLAGSSGTEIQQRVRKIEGLPMLPTTHADIMEMVRSERASSEDIAQKLQLDPALQATVFKLANAALFGFRHRIDTLKLAITVLGLETIANMVMSAQVFEAMKASASDKDAAGLDLDAFWKHSVGTAFIARALGKRLQVDAESAFLAGMLHDLGKIILDRFFSDYYLTVIDHVRKTQDPIVHAEQELLGLTHAQVGGQLAVEWKFAEKFQDAILYHHFPDARCRYQRLVCLVHLADAFCRKLGCETLGKDQEFDVHDCVRDRFSLGDRKIQRLFTEVAGELEKADAFHSVLKEPNA